jgi:hypothetical protein
MTDSLASASANLMEADTALGFGRYKKLNAE